MLVLLLLACAPTAETAKTAQDWCEVAVAEMAECETVDWSVPDERPEQVTYCEEHNSGLIAERGETEGSLVSYWSCLATECCGGKRDRCFSLIASE